MNTLNLPNGTRLELIPAGSGWQLSLAGSATGGVGAVQTDAPVAVETAARWLVDRLAEPVDDELRVPPADGGFTVRRLSPLGPTPAGERQVTADQTNLSVIVGEQVVVKWLRRVDDAEHPALSALAHLAEVGFTGTPTSYGALTWRTPDGAEVPVGIAAAFLPGAADGWQWCVEAIESGDRLSFPAELGRLLAGLHAAFATPSSVLAAPVGSVDDVVIRRWHAAARSRLAEIVDRAGELDDAAAGTDGARPQRAPSVAIAEHRPAMTAVIDRLLAVSGPTSVQRIHADLHVGQVLQWAGGLAVIDFDGNPMLAEDRPTSTNDVVQSPVRDLAQLLLSLDQAGRIADRRAGFSITAEMNAWSRTARADLLAAYLSEVANLGSPVAVDLRLLPMFLVEQACRDLLYAVRFLPRWAYATIDGLDLILAELADHQG